MRYNVEALRHVNVQCTVEAETDTEAERKVLDWLDTHEPLFESAASEFNARTEQITEVEATDALTEVVNIVEAGTDEAKAEDEVIVIEVDCHAAPWHATDEYWARNADADKPPAESLAEFGRAYGVTVDFLENHHLKDWAWWYRIEGPRKNVRHFLTQEYTGDDAWSCDMIACVVA